MLHHTEELGLEGTGEAADIEIGLPLYRYFTCGLEALRDRPRLAAYYARLSERPAYAEHVMVNYDVLKT